MWAQVGQFLLSGVTDYFSRKQEIKAEQHKQTVERIKQGEAAAGESDRQSLMDRGWKDDYLLVITTAPLVFSFIPPLAPFVAPGFENLGSVPEYYWYGLAMVYIDTFGFRQMCRQALQNFLLKRVG